jgi:inorganic pyrophosphatase
MSALSQLPPSPGAGLVHVVVESPRGATSKIKQPRDLSDRVREEIEHFFVDVTFFEHKHARVLGWDGPRAALALVDSTRTGRRKRGRG